MTKNKYGGLLVAIDGPNGVGKTTLIEGLISKLKQGNLNVVGTREPTDSQIGKFTRTISETLDGKSLACLVGADRYYHLDQEIIPYLKEERIVLTDRYILSSLILQRMDNVDTPFILNINSNIVLPDIQFAVIASENIIYNRLDNRTELTRFERGTRTCEELHFLSEGINVLQGLGVNVISINNEKNLDYNINLMYDYIQKEWGAK